MRTRESREKLRLSLLGEEGATGRVGLTGESRVGFSRRERRCYESCLVMGFGGFARCESVQRRRRSTVMKSRSGG